MKRFLIKSFVFNLLCVFSSESKAFYTKLQHAGEIGFASFGVGIDKSDLYSFELFYGVVPRSYAITSKVETIAFKNNYNMLNASILKMYLGWSLFHVLGKKYQTSKDVRFPNGYYVEASIRGLVYYGLNLNISKKYSMYFENGLSDIWLENYVNNYYSLNLNDIMFLAIGVKLNL